MAGSNLPIKSTTQSNHERALLQWDAAAVVYNGMHLQWDAAAIAATQARPVDARV
jgi:hypothetical protein